MRHRAVLLSCLLLLTVGGALIVFVARAGWPRREPPLPSSIDFPDDGKVAGVAVCLYNSCQDEPDEPEFELPAEFVPDVLAILRPVRVARHHRAVEEYGAMCLTLRDGDKVELRLYRLNKEPVLFLVQGVPCTRGGPYKDMAPGKHKYFPESFAFEGLLRELALVARGSGSRGRALEILNKFDQSAGREDRRRKAPAGS
jgi:hypothetical protein